MTTYRFRIWYWKGSCYVIFRCGLFLWHLFHISIRFGFFTSLVYFSLPPFLLFELNTFLFTSVSVFVHFLYSFFYLFIVSWDFLKHQVVRVDVSYCYSISCRMVYLPINAHQKQPDNFDEILQANAHVERYLKEKCSSEHYQQLSFKYFVKSFSILKLL